MKRFVVGALLVAAGCSGTGTDPRGLGLGSWKVGSNHATYVVLSDPGRPYAAPQMVLRGSWDLLIASDGSITGTWEAHAVEGADSAVTGVGPQVGSGTLEGYVQGDGSLGINMNPGMFDNNVFVTVAPQGGELDATWEWSTIAGPWKHGYFRIDPPVF